MLLPWLPPLSLLFVRQRQRSHLTEWVHPPSYPTREWAARGGPVPRPSQSLAQWTFAPHPSLPPPKKRLLARSLAGHYCSYSLAAIHSAGPICHSLLQPVVVVVFRKTKIVVARTVFLSTFGGDPNVFCHSTWDRGQSSHRNFKNEDVVKIVEQAVSIQC